MIRRTTNFRRLRSTGWNPPHWQFTLRFQFRSPTVLHRSHISFSLHLSIQIVSFFCFCFVIWLQNDQTKNKNKRKMFKFLKGVVGGSGAGVKDLPYNIGDPYPSAWGSWSHFQGTSKVIQFSFSFSFNYISLRLHQSNQSVTIHQNSI